MKNTMKRLLCLLLALIMCAGLGLGAVAEEDEDPSICASEFTAIKPSTLALFEGQTINVTADVQPSNYNMGIDWKSDAPGIATVVSDDTATATVTANSEGTARITATVTGADGEKIAQICTVTVNPNVMESVTIESADGSSTISGTGTLQLHAYAVYSDDSRPILNNAIWSSSNTDIATVTSEGLVNAVGVGEVTITAKANNDDDTLKDTFTIKVTEPITYVVLNGGGVTGGNGKYTLTLSPGGTAQLSAEVQPKNTFTEPGPITWEVPNNSTVVSVDNGKITALSNGTVKINVKCDGATSAELTVTVGIPNKNITVSTIQGSTIKGTTSIKTKLIDAYKEVYGSDPSDDMKLTITPSSNSSTYGTLYKNSATGNSSNKVTSSNSLSISEVGGMYFVPASAGSYSASYTLFSSDKTTTLLKGTITITVTSKERDVTITLSDDSPYTFSTTSNVEKAAVTKLIGDAVKDATGSTTYSYIILGSPSTASKNIGTLYANSSKKSLDTYDNYTYKSGTGSIGNLYFVPAHKEGTYSIPYTAYSSGGTELCSGSLKIEVGADDGTVTVTLDDDSPYTFSSKTKKDSTSAANAIYKAIDNEYNVDYSYIVFGSVSSGSSVGKLYTDSDRKAISTKNKYYRIGTRSDYLVSDLYFVPAKAGTYVQEFTAYDSYEDKILTGTLKIVVPGDSSGDDMDIYFNTTTGSTISLTESVFENWFRKEKGSSYKLAYVTFDDVSSTGYGTFKNGSSSFTPGNDVKYYDEDYMGSTGSNAKYLGDVKFTAPNSAGYVSVDFTCYGGTSVSSSGTTASGTFYIYVTKSSVKSVAYDVNYGSALTLDEDDFASVYKNAMSGSSSAKFYIELLELPSKGTMYYNYTSSSKPGTKLTTSNFDDYEFYVNSSSSYDSVEDLTYVPANTSGTVSVRYLASDTDGEPLYVGSISFSYGKEQTSSISCGPEGYTFKNADFYSSSDSDPVEYVTFRQPSTGELMLNYTNGRGVSLPSTVRLYTTSYTSGSYALSALSYIPKAGFSGDVTVNYTAVTESGDSRNGVLTISVSGKKGSSHFKDVTTTGSGAWASDAIDFAYKWGLVNGTGTDTFSPDNTMTRAMLVTILYRSAGTPKVSGSCPFTDVPAGTYYYDAVIWGAENGIVTGTSPTTFSPNRDVNREQVAAFLHRYAKYNGENVAVTGTLNGYSDKAYVSSYAIEPVTWAVQHGYITSNSGTSELLLSPGGNATRAQVAVMLHRFLTY